jgi:hypothetical protein
MGKGESNERREWGYDEEEPPHLNIEKTHIVTQTKRKMSTGKKSTRSFKSPLNDVIEMEVDDNNVPEWVTLQMIENR